MRERFAVALVVVGVVSALVNGTTPSGAATPITPSASATDITTDSAVLHATVSHGQLQGSCTITTWATVTSVGNTPPYQKETEHTKASAGQRVSHRVDGLAPNSRYAYTSTVRVTGFGGDFAPCRDVYELTTSRQEFTTAPEHAHGFSSGSTANVTQGIMHLHVSARPAPHGTSTIRLEYGPTVAYGRGGGAVPCTAATCTATLTLPPDPTVLTPNATYHFRAVVQNEYSGTQHGPDDTFTAIDTCKLPPKTSANYTGCVFHGLDWSKKDAEFIVLDGAKMQRANLSGATLHGAKMAGTDLTEADLRDVRIFGVKGPKAILIDAKMQGAAMPSNGDLSGALLQRANLTKANIQGMNLSGADLTGAFLTGALAAHVDFRAAILAGTDLSGANLDGAILPASIAQAKCSDTTRWPDNTRSHGTECPPPS